MHDQSKLSRSAIRRQKSPLVLTLRWYVPDTGGRMKRCYYSSEKNPHLQYADPNAEMDRMFRAIIQRYIGKFWTGYFVWNQPNQIAPIRKYNSLGNQVKPTPFRQWLHEEEV